MKRIIALAAIALALPLSAHAWWNSDWSGRKKITLDTKAATIAADVSTVPVLVRLSSGNFDFLSAKEDGSDLRFVAEDEKTEIPFQVERFDKVNELAFVWVQVPKLAANNPAQHIWIYYGNEKAGEAKAASVFDANQVATFHFSEAQGAPVDASAAATAVGEWAGAAVPSGLIGGSARFTGQGGFVANAAGLQGAPELSVSAWVNADKGTGELFSVGNLKLSLNGGNLQLQVGSESAKAPEALPLATWHHIGVSAGKEAVLFVDGKAVAKVAAAVTPAAAVRIAGSLEGQLDEVQIAKVARSEAWMAAQFQSQGETGKLVKLGDDQTTDTSESPNYFKSTLQNLTPDGWVVVGICVVMFFIAIGVMISKARLLRRQGRSNGAFATEFSNLSNTLRTLGNSVTEHSAALKQLAARDTDFGQSSLHRIYKVGVDELGSRLHTGDAVHALPVLSSQTMNAVRASLDAQMTRERHGLEKNMVLLTIAISGGPFLGLLGTVVGVMITFAAIAAAGDVNVNAIAPGIAASLVATVAGLGVAIPALFGYNYLMTQIKSVNADMTVFVDEFVTKMAENYGA